MTDFSLTDRNGWLSFAKLSITNPRAAGDVLMRLPIGTQMLRTWIALIIVLNGILYSLVLPVALLPVALAGSPILLTLGMGAMILVIAWITTAVGRMFGGQAGLTEILTVTVWLQSLRLAAQVAIMVVSILLPPLGVILGLAVAVWGVYMMVAFLSAAHRFDSLWKGFGTLVAAFVASVLILSILTSVLGVAPVETT